MESQNIFRSEEMSLIQILIQAESARAAVSELGELGVIQFRDLNPDVTSFQRHYVNEVKRVDEMERRLRFLTSQFEKAGIKKKATTLQYSRAKNIRELDELDEKLKELEEDIIQMNKNEASLAKNQLELTELKHVLRETDILFDESSFTSLSNATEELEQEQNRTIKLTFVTGVIKREKRNIFERILWRSLRGNLFMKMAKLTKPFPIPKLVRKPKRTFSSFFVKVNKLDLKLKRFVNLSVPLYTHVPKLKMLEENSLFKFLKDWKILLKFF